MTPSNPIKRGSYYGNPFNILDTPPGAPCMDSSGNLYHYVGPSPGKKAVYFRSGLGIVSSRGLMEDGSCQPMMYTLSFVSTEEANRATAEPPDPIAPGHNPHKLTLSQVGEDWKLITSSNEKPDKRAQLWMPSKNSWDFRAFELTAPYSPTDCYRIPTSPPKRIPLTPADFPPGTAVRMTVWESLETYDLVLAASEVAIWVVTKQTHSYNNPAFMNMYQRLLPGTTEWLPCYKEE